MNGSSDSHSHQLAVMGMRLIDEFRALEDAIVSMAATMPREHVETFTEFAIDEILVDYARNTRSPEGPRIHMALGRRLRGEVHRRLVELRNDHRG